MLDVLTRDPLFEVRGSGFKVQRSVCRVQFWLLATAGWALPGVGSLNTRLRVAVNTPAKLVALV
jgi:hypothetical protein